MTDIIKKIILHLEECYEKELDALVEAGRLAKDGDSIPLELSINEELLIEDRRAFSGSGISLEQGLYQHVDYYINNAQRRERQLIILLQEAIGTYRRILIIYEGMLRASVSRPIDAILLFSPFWIRDPLHWDKSSNVSIVQHLFVEYPVPEKLYEKWYETLDTKNTKYLVWFILLAQGGSLKEASKLFGWNIYSKFQHFYVQQDSWVETQKEACIRAEIQRMSGSWKLSSYFKHNPAYFIDPTDSEIEKKFHDFWYRTVDWLIRYYDELEHEQIGAILDWAMHHYTEAEREKKTFSWKGRALHNVILLSEIYAIKNTLKERNVRWDSHKMDWEYSEANDRAWTICEITTAKELFEESLELRHCANEYLDSCLSGHTAVFSMRCNQVRTVTIEVDLSKRIIKQARGKKNRGLKKNERKILKKWRLILIERRREQTLKETEMFEFLLKIYKFKSLYSLNYRGNTILHEIVKKGANKDLEIVIKAGLPIDFENYLGETPLMTAVKLRKRDMVCLLTNAGADVNYGLSASRNVLTYAFQAGNSLIVRDLLKCGAAIKPHHTDRGASGKQKIMFNLLVKHRGDLNMKTTSG